LYTHSFVIPAKAGIHVRMFKRDVQERSWILAGQMA
jgi:hypothetical protein